MKLRSFARVLVGHEWNPFGELSLNDRGNDQIPWEVVANAAVEHAGADDIYMIFVERWTPENSWATLAQFGPYGLIEKSVPTLCELAISA